MTDIEITQAELDYGRKKFYSFRDRLEKEEGLEYILLFFVAAAVQPAKTLMTISPLSPVSRFKINLNLNSILDFLEVADNFKKEC